MGKSAYFFIFAIACLVGAAVALVFVPAPKVYLVSGMLIPLGFFFSQIGLKWAAREGQLKNLLGSTPYGLPKGERWKWLQANQPMADKELSELAKSMKQAFGAEEELIQSSADCASGTELNKELAYRARKARLAKKAFWEVHALFETFGFKVKTHYTDYLP